MATQTPVRQRFSFGTLERALELPDLIEIQKRSYESFLTDGLAETVQDVSPIVDYTGNLAVEFGEFEFDAPTIDIDECREQEKTFSAPLSMTVRFVNRDTGEIREQRVFMGDFPLMTPAGTFIINGTERVIVTQLVRSPGAYLMRAKDPAKALFTANLMPSRGSWLELEIDKKGILYARIDRKRKLPATVLLRVLGYGRDHNILPADNTPEAEKRALDERIEDERVNGTQRILDLFEGSQYIANTLAKDTVTTMEEGLIELFKKQRPGEPPTLENSRTLLRTLFFDPKRYDLTRVGRYKLNTRLSHSVDGDLRTLAAPIFTGSLMHNDITGWSDDSLGTTRLAEDLTGDTDDLVQLMKKLLDLPTQLGVPHENAEGEPTKDYAEATRYLPIETIGHEIDEYEDFGNRRLRTVGELIQEAFRVGLYRMERVVRERMTTEDPDTITPQSIINIRPVVAALKEFFGSSALSQFMDQTNSLAGLKHRRTLSALGTGGLTRERAPIEVRDVHPTHYGRMCPIETPEGPNIGLIGSLASHATVSEHGFIATPYRQVKNGKVTGEIHYLDASQEEDMVVAEATDVDPQGHITPDVGDFVTARGRKGDIVAVLPKEVDYVDVEPAQLVSISTAMIPFLEHDDANRALMGSNMQRQAVPLLQPQAPFVGTGLEARAAVDSGDVLVAHRGGVVVQLDAERVGIDVGGGEVDIYDMIKFRRSNQGTIIHQRPLVKLGQKVASGSVIADGSSTDNGEIALGRNLTVAFMSWEGYNFEDSIILNERLVKQDLLTSVHISEYEVDARTTKLGDEEITRDIPNRSEESLAQLDEDGIVRVGAEVRSGDLLVGKVTPKGETELTAEEKLIRAIFKEKAREVRDTSLKVPHGSGGVVIDVKTFSREDGDDLSPGVNKLVKVFVATKRKIAEGDKLAGRHGNKGVISKIVPEEDMPFLEDGSAVDIILNPLGVPSRMNIGQVLETHLGWAALNGWQEAWDVVGENSVEGAGTVFVSTPVFDGATLADVDRVLDAATRARAKKTRDMRLGDDTFEFSMQGDPEAVDGRKWSGKLRLFSGRSGEPYDFPVMVGVMYILKLHHLVDDKIHARSTGPYSLVTQQPLGGKAQFGGQRFGEMEVWALEAYGAAYTLQEMLTVKSDDTVGRVKAYEAIVKGENIPEPTIPESFKVLLKEIQSLALDIRVQTSSGAVLEVTEEQDELVRAAEELGIELAPVAGRATAESPSAQDVEEGNDKVDPDGIFNIAADESTGTVVDLDAELAGVDTTSVKDDEEDPFASLAIDEDVSIKDLEGDSD
ncbi:MAG: DNA-directed polymerase subunit beta [Thermoleophilia bacterium]|nr:DNA-directed polymerase subunit beta [Thermoleophilia bacterium]